MRTDGVRRDAALESRRNAATSPLAAAMCIGSMSDQIATAAGVDKIVINET